MLTIEEEGAMAGVHEASINSGLTRPTINALGLENQFIDPVTQECIKAIKNLPGIPHIADLGVAFGYSTLQLLADTSAVVTANDLQAEHLAELASRIPKDQKDRVTTVVGDALQLDFEENSLDGIMALRWMHFLGPAEIRRAFGKFAKWLKPGGLLCITACTPYTIFAEPNFRAIYQQRVARNQEWPGRMELGSVCFPKQWIDVERGYLFDKSVLEREATSAGFHVRRLSYISIGHLSNDGQENVGLLAVRP
jgi:SAM-dependent methyltransferase